MKTYTFDELSERAQQHAFRLFLNAGGIGVFSDFRAHAIYFGVKYYQDGFEI